MLGRDHHSEVAVGWAIDELRLEMEIDGEERLPPAACGVLQDLVSQRGLVDVQVKLSDSVDAWLIIGSVLVERLQDNRLQRKRKHIGGAADTMVDTGSAEQRSRCVFVIVNTAQEAATSVQRLLQLHAAATRASSPPSPEHIYLCLTDAGNISYYLMESGFAGPMPPST